MFGKKKSKKPQAPQKPSAQRPVNPNASGNVSAPRNTVPSAAAQRSHPPVKKKGIFGGKKHAPKPALSPQQRNSQNPQNRVPQNQQRVPQNQQRVPQNQQRVPQNQQRVPQNQQRVSQNQQRAPQKPIKPVNPQARKAVDKAAREKQSAVKKRPYRGGNYTLYFVLFGIIAVIVLIILANTVLFKCSSIEVIGTSRYTAEEITASAGIKTGDNLLHINTKKAEENIIKDFAFVDKAAVKKAFPSKIQIEITEAENWFAIKQDNKIHVISRGSRILGQIPANGLVVVNGFEAESVEVGSYIKSKVDAKNKIPAYIFETAEKVGFEGITEIDITDRFSIKISLGGRIVLNLGPSTQLESKLRVAQALIEQHIGEDEQVVIILTNPEKPAVDNLKPAQKPSYADKPESKPNEPESSSEPTESDSEPNESDSEPAESDSEPTESGSNVQDDSSGEQPDLITLPT